MHYSKYLLNLFLPGIICFFMLNGIFYSWIMELSDVFNFHELNVGLACSALLGFLFANSVVSLYKTKEKAIVEMGYLMAFLLTLISMDGVWILSSFTEPYYLPGAIIRGVVIFLGVWLAQWRIFFELPIKKGLILTIIIIFISAYTFAPYHPTGCLVRIF